MIYSITYVPLKAMKGQMVADFIVDHFIVSGSLNYLELEFWKLYFDGSSHRDGTGIRILIISPNIIPKIFKSRIERLCSNNEGLIDDLEIILELEATRVKIMGDLELVVKQMTKEYKCVRENLIMYFVIANQLFRKFKMMNIIHIHRLKN